MTQDRSIKGAGGGGSREPTRTKDSFLSQDYVEVLLALGEGPIRGLVQSAPGSMENFFVGDTPLHSVSTGLANFSDFNVTGYPGAETDPPIEFTMGGISSNLSINVQLSSQVPVVRQTLSAARNNINRLEFRLYFNQLVKTTDDGTFETTAKFRVSYKRASSPTWIDYQGEAESTMRGKTTGGSVKDFIIDVPLVNEDYDLRVIKISPDSTPGVDEEIVEMTWESVQMVKTGTQSFPNVALVHLHGKASNQFSSVPDFSGIYDGLIVDVPTNYNASTRTYDESVPWNGTFKKAYTNNPAWVLYSLCTNPRFGLPRYYLTVSANRYEFYAAAKWCDESVPNGVGGFQPRFTFNDEISEAKQGMELLRYVAGAFNSIIFDDGNGNISLRTDQPRTPVQIFTPENISQDGFSYTFTDIPTRYNDISVSFINPDLDWATDRRSITVDNTAWIEANGRIPYDFVAVGCTDVHEAVRRANYRAITANTEKATVSFVTSRFGLLTELFSTIYIADPDADWSTGGRIKNVVGSTIHLRDPIFFPTTTPRNMRVQTYTGLVSITVAPPTTGAVYSLNVTDGVFPANVPDRTVFTIEDNATLGLAKPFKVLSIEEVEGKVDVYRISALEVNVNKYPDADSGTLSESVEYSYTRPGEPILPLAITVDTPRPIISKDGSLQYRIEISYQRPVGSNTARYEIDFKEVDTVTWTTIVSYGDSAYLSPVSDGKSYDIRLFAVSPLGLRSRKSVNRDAYLVSSKAGTLPDATGIAVTKVEEGWSVTWDDPTNIPDWDGVDLRVGLQALSFNMLPSLYRTKVKPQPVPWLEAGDIRFRIKHTDTSGNKSQNDLSFPVSISSPQTPTLALEEGFGSSLVRFQDCTTTQPLREIQVRRGLPTDTWNTATSEGAQSPGVRSFNVVPNALDDTRIFVRAVDKGGNASGIGIVDVPAAANNVQELLDIIENGIGLDNLADDVLTTLNLITGPDTDPNSVAGKVKAESLARIAAIDAEVLARTNALTDMASSLTSAFTAADGTTLNTAQTFTQNYTYEKTTIDGALSSLFSQITTNYQTADAGVIANAQSYVQTYSYSKADSDQSLVTLSNTLSASFSAADTATLITANANMESYTYSRATIDSSFTSLSSTLTASFQSADAVNLAAAKAYTYSQADINNAISSATTSVRASIGDDITSAVQTEAIARANADGHFSAQWSMQVALVNGGSTAAIGGIAVVGTSGGGGGPNFSMAFRANSFTFLPPAGSGNEAYSPLVFYATPQVFREVNIPAGLYTRNAFIEYITADQIDTRGLKVRAEDGTIILAAGTNLAANYITPANNWINGNITITGGTINGIGAGNGARVDNNDTLLQAQISNAALTAQWSNVSGVPPAISTNRVTRFYRQASQPVAGDLIVGDKWQRLDAWGIQLEDYTWNGSTWVAQGRPAVTTYKTYNGSATDDATAWAQFGSTFGTSGDGAAFQAFLDAGMTARIGDIIVYKNAIGTYAGARMLVDRNFYGWSPINTFINGSMVVQGGIKAQHISVTSLSSLTAVIGFLTSRSGGTGAGYEQDSNGYRVYDSSNQLRVKIGLF